MSVTLIIITVRQLPLYVALIKVTTPKQLLTETTFVLLACMQLKTIIDIIIFVFYVHSLLVSEFYFVFSTLAYLKCTITST